MKQILVMVAAATMLVACAAPEKHRAIASANDEFARLAAEVEREIRATDKTGFLWRDTEQILRDARAAQAEGRYAEAKELANRALRQAQLAQQQARENANAGPTYPKP
jgi:hypothetical protein